MFYVFIFVFSFIFIDTPMEVVSPGGMFVYTAVYTLAADGQERVGFSVGW